MTPRLRENRTQDDENEGSGGGRSVGGGGWADEGGGGAEAKQFQLPARERKLSTTDHDEDGSDGNNIAFIRLVAGA